MKNWKYWGNGALLFASGLLLGSTQSCKEAEAAANDIAEQCKLTCAAEGIAQGNASISGVAKVDAFFAAVVNFNAAANKASANIEAQLARIRTSLELDASATPAQIVAKIQSKFQLDGGIKVVYKEPECSVSAQATLDATARCEGHVDPGSVSVECKGTCEVEAGAEVDCGADATLKCVGTAPNLACDGTCEGSCELEGSVACSGTCNGTCDGTCSVMNADGSCAGKCEGKCEGSCELTAGGECNGKCKGECTYTPGGATCQANATAHCEAKANASVECKGRCDGEVTPPSASAECQASAKAEAEVNVECTPPSVDVEYAFKASASADVQAEFEAFLVRFRTNISGIVSELARADVVLKAGAELGASANAAVKASVQASADGELGLRETIGLGCALKELPKVGAAIQTATNRLSGNVSASTELTTKLVAGS